MSKVIRDIGKLKENARLACRLFLTECENRGLDVKITETLRTKERQNELYEMGRTAPGQIVTWTKKSRHQSGLAWDICKAEKGREYSDREFFKSCGAVAKSLGIDWGGNWKTPDLPHFEVSADWEVENMEEFLRLKKEVEELKNRQKVYRYTVELPDWARPTIQKLMDRGIYSGSAEDDLNLPEDMARVLVILDRSGIFDR